MRSARIASLMRIEESFSVLLGSGPIDTVGAVVDRVCVRLHVAANVQININRPPSIDELRNAAQTDLVRALRAIGFSTDDNFELDSSPEALLPRENRRELWQKLAAALEIEPKLLEPRMGAFLSVSFVAFGAYLALWVIIVQRLDPILAALWPIFQWTIGLAAFAVMWIGALAWSVGIATLFVPRQFIPYNTIRDWTSDIASKKEHVYTPILCKPERVVVSDFVRQVVAEEFGEAIESVNDDYSLWQLHTSRRRRK